MRRLIYVVILSRSLSILRETEHDKTYKMTSMSSKDSDQPGYHPMSFCWFCHDVAHISSWDTFFALPFSLLDKLSQLMRLLFLSHRPPAKAQVSLRIHAVSTEPSLFAHMKHGSR